MRHVVAICTLLIFALPPFLFGAEPDRVTLTYTESSEIFANPERGFHRWTELRKPTPPYVLQNWAISGLRDEGVSLILGLIIVSDYTDRDFDAALLDQISQGLDLVRDAGLKANIRVHYGSDYFADPDLDTMLRHIDQLQPVLEANADVINLVEAGFIGPWGEWHSSNLGNPPTVENMTAVLEELLFVLPPDRMVSIRRPMFRRQIYADSQAPGGYEVLEETAAFDGSNLARTGYHNDAFVTSDNDLGTYVDPGWSRSEELADAGHHSRFTPFGGESSWHSPLHELTQCEHSLAELETLHATYLNDGWYGPVLDRWETQGCMDEITRRLGYRFVLDTLQAPGEVRPGGVLHLTAQLRNAGFAALFNPRAVELVLQQNDSRRNAQVSEDPRTWEPGQTITLDRYFRIPADIPEGYYNLKLNLPDPAPTLQDDPRYSVRLANDGVWDETNGDNTLLTGLHIHSAAPGVATTDTVFEELPGYVPDPDSDGDGVCDCSDNCPDIANPDQADMDADGIGDVCDNCPALCNTEQRDADNDGAGDACDAAPGCGGCAQPVCESACAPDTDGDFRQDSIDNCPDTANPDQSDVDADGFGDVCDNCPDACNTQQLDADEDGAGDVCDDTPGCGSCTVACEQEC